MSGLKLITPPAIEPVSLAEVKAHLRLDTAADDALLQSLIVTARSVAESWLGRALIAQGWREVRDEAPRRPYLTLSKSPLLSVSAVRVYDGSDVATLLDSGVYFVDTASQPGRLMLRSSGPWPEVGRSAAGLEVDYLAGYGATAADVPAPIRQGMLAHIAYLYTQRGDMLGSDGALQVDQAASVPSLTLALYAPYRVLRLTGSAGEG